MALLSADDELVKLKTLVLRTLESTGALSGIRAQLRNVVYKSINDKDACLSPGFVDTNIGVVQKNLNGTSQQIYYQSLSFDLVSEWLEVSGYKMTASMLQHEHGICVGGGETRLRGRDELCREYQVDPLSHQSVLNQVLNSFNNNNVNIVNNNNVNNNMTQTQVNTVKTNPLSNNNNSINLDTPKDGASPMDQEDHVPNVMGNPNILNNNDSNSGSGNNISNAITMTSSESNSSINITGPPRRNINEESDQVVTSLSPGPGPGPTSLSPDRGDSNMAMETVTEGGGNTSLTGLGGGLTGLSSGVGLTGLGTSSGIENNGLTGLGSHSGGGLSGLGGGGLSDGLSGGGLTGLGGEGNSLMSGLGGVGGSFTGLGGGSSLTGLGGGGLTGLGNVNSNFNNTNTNNLNIDSDENAVTSIQKFDEDDDTVEPITSLTGLNSLNSGNNSLNNTTQNQNQNQTQNFNLTGLNSSSGLTQSGNQIQNLTGLGNTSNSKKDPEPDPASVNEISIDHDIMSEIEESISVGASMSDDADDLNVGGGVKLVENNNEFETVGTNSNQGTGYNQTQSQSAVNDENNVATTVTAVTEIDSVAKIQNTELTIMSDSDININKQYINKQQPLPPLSLTTTSQPQSTLPIATKIPSLSAADILGEDDDEDDDKYKDDFDDNVDQDDDDDFNKIDDIDDVLNGEEDEDETPIVPLMKNDFVDSAANESNVTNNTLNPGVPGQTTSMNNLLNNSNLNNSSVLNQEDESGVDYSVDSNELEVCDHFEEVNKF